MTALVPRHDAPSPDAAEVEDLPVPGDGGGGRPRHRGRWVLLGLLVVLLVAGAGAVFSPLLAVRTVDVRGAGSLPRSEVLRAAGITEGEPMVGVSLRRARARLRALPAVASARLVREWPTTLRIVLTLERPLVSFVAPGRAVLVTANGRVLSAVADAAKLPRQVPRVALDSLGPLEAGDVVPAALRDVAEVHAESPPAVLAELVSGRLARNGDLVFRSPRGGRIVFGPAEDVPAKVLAVSTVLGGRVVRDCLDVLDVRDPARPTVSRTPGCAVPPPTSGAAGRPAGGPRPAAPGRLVCTRLGCKVVGGPADQGAGTTGATGSGTGNGNAAGNGTGPGATGGSAGRLVCTPAGCRVVGGSGAGGSSGRSGTVPSAGGSAATGGTGTASGGAAGAAGGSGGRLVCTRAGCTVVGGPSSSGGAGGRGTG